MFAMHSHYMCPMTARSYVVSSVGRWLRIGVVMLVAFPAGQYDIRAEDRLYDGTGNNLANPLWGSAGSDYLREASGAHYADGIWAPVVAGLPSARAVSN